MHVTITKRENILQVGKDLADAVAGKVICHGELEINHETRRTWVSTLPIADTEHWLRLAAKKEGRSITLFISQGN